MGIKISEIEKLRKKIVDLNDGDGIIINSGSAKVELCFEENILHISEWKFKVFHESPCQVIVRASYRKGYDKNRTELSFQAEGKNKAEACESVISSINVFSNTKVSELITVIGNL